MRSTFLAVPIFVLSISAAGSVQPFILSSDNRIECSLDPPSGQSMPDNAVIELRMASGGQIDRGTPSGNGRLIFSGLATGQYSISVQAEGFLFITRDVEIPSGSIHNTIHVVLRLTPRPEPDGAPSPKSERTVGVSSLKVPEDALNELKQAEKAAAQGSLDHAIEHAEKAIELYPEYFEAYNNLAVYQSQAGRNEEATLFFEKAIALHPDAVGANLNLGRVLLDLNRPREAVVYLKHAAEVDKTAAVIQYHLARALILCDRLPDAVKPLKRALELQPPVDRACFLLAHVLYQLGDIAGAVREMESYLKTKPPQADELKQLLRTWKKLESSSRN